MRPPTLLASCCALAMGWGAARPVEAADPFRPPAVPLVACDPYFSIWSFNDKLTDANTRHWTGRPQPLHSMIRVDGQAFRLMGGDADSTVPALPQTSVQVLPTRTIYEFANPSVHVTLTFLTPALVHDLAILARPVTYLTWEVRSDDGKPHDASLFFSASAALAVDTPGQKVVWSQPEVAGLDVLRVGSEEQSVLRRKGDDLRIDWGHLYVAAARNEGKTAIGPERALLQAFAERGKLPAGTDARQPRAVSDASPALAFTFDLGRVDTETKSYRLILAYDDEYSITYFRQNLRPYWRKDGVDAAQLLRMSEAESNSLHDRCEQFDTELMADLTRAGGAKYATLGALAYRQALAAHKLVADRNGQPLLFSKENFSNGCIATVDITYPGAPLFLLLNPTLAKASIAHVLSYSGSDRWKFPFAPHDLGTYPLANGQVYGGGERSEDNQMPVEETGNILLILGAIARIDGNADFASTYWPQLRNWAKYLEAKGFDPEISFAPTTSPGTSPTTSTCRPRRSSGWPLTASSASIAARRPKPGATATSPSGMAKRWVAEGTDGDQHQARLRPGQHLEPEVQPGLGQAPQARHLPGRGHRAGGGLLPQAPGQVRPPARQPEALRQARLDGLDRHDGRQAR